MNCGRFRFLIQQRFDVEISPQDDHALLIHLETCESCQKFHHQVQQVILASEELPIPEELLPPKLEALARTVMEQLPQPKQGPMAKVMEVLEKLKGLLPQKNGKLPAITTASNASRGSSFPHVTRHGGSGAPDMENPQRPKRFTEEDAEEAQANSSRLRALPRSFTQDNMIDSREAQSSTRSLGEKFLGQPGAQLIDDQPLTLAESIRRKMSESKAKESSDMHEGPIPQSAPIEGSDWMKPSGQHARLPGGGAANPVAAGGSWANPSEATGQDSWSTPAGAGQPGQANDWKMFNQPGGPTMPRQNTGPQPVVSGPRVESWSEPTTPSDQIADPWSTPLAAKPQAPPVKPNDSWQATGADPNQNWGKETPGGIGDAWAQPGQSLGNDSWSQPANANAAASGPSGWQSPPNPAISPAPAPAATTPSAFSNLGQPSGFNQPPTAAPSYPAQNNSEWGPPPQHGAWDGPLEEENFVRRPEPPSAVAPKPIMKLGTEDAPRPSSPASPWQELKQSKTNFPAAHEPAAQAPAPAPGPGPANDAWSSQPAAPQWPSMNSDPVQPIAPAPTPPASPVANWNSPASSGNASNPWGPVANQNAPAPQQASSAPSAPSWNMPQPASNDSGAWSSGGFSEAPQPITSPIAPPTNFASNSLANSPATPPPAPQQQGTSTGNKLSPTEILNKRPAWSLEAEQVETGTWKAFRPVEELGANSSSKIPVVNPGSGQNLAPPVPPPANDKDDWDLPIQEKLARQRAREAAAQAAQAAPAPAPAPAPMAAPAPAAPQYVPPPTPAPAAPQYAPPPTPAQFAPPPAPVAPAPALQAPVAPIPVTPTAFPQAQTPAASMAPPSAEANPWGSPKQNNIPDADLWDLDAVPELAPQAASSLDKLGTAIGEQASMIASPQSFSPSDAWSGEAKASFTGNGSALPAADPYAATSSSQKETSPHLPVAVPVQLAIGPANAHSMGSFAGSNSSINNLTASSWDLQVIQASEQLGQPAESAFSDSNGFSVPATSAPATPQGYAQNAPLNPAQGSGMPRIAPVETKGAFEPGEITSRLGDMTAATPSPQAAPAPSFPTPAPQPAPAFPTPAAQPTPASSFSAPAPLAPAVPDRGPNGLFKLDDDAMDKLFKDNLGVNERAAANAQAQAQTPAVSWPNNAATSPKPATSAPVPIPTPAVSPSMAPWGPPPDGARPPAQGSAWPSATTQPTAPARPAPPQPAQAPWNNSSQYPTAPQQQAAQGWPSQNAQPSPPAPQAAPAPPPASSWPTAPAPSISGPVQSSPQQWPTASAPQPAAPAPAPSPAPQAPWINSVQPAPVPAPNPAVSNPGGYAAPAPAPQQQGSGLFSIDDSIIDRIFADNLGIKDGGAAKVPKVNVSEAVKQISNVAESAAVPPPKIEGLGRLDSRPDTSDASSGRISSIGKFLLDGKDLEKIGKITSADLSDTTMRILTMEAAGELQSLLGHIGAHPGVVGSVIVGHDGLMIANTMPPEMDMPGEQLGVWALAVYMNTSNAARKLGNNKVYQLVSKTPKGYLIIADFGSGLLVTVSDSMNPESLVPLMRNITQLVAP